jgi:hypothetical protein
MRSISKKKALLASGLASASLASLILVGGVAFAQTNQSPNGGLAQSIASKFNLNKDDVQKVIDQQHQDMTKQHLDKLVTNGKITQEQEDKIIAKLAEMKPKFDAAKSNSDETARKQAMDDLRAEMQQWEKDNKIPKGVIGQLHGPRGPKPQNGKTPSNIQPVTSDDGGVSN